MVATTWSEAGSILDTVPLELVTQTVPKPKARRWGLPGTSTLATTGDGGSGGIVGRAARPPGGRVEDEGRLPEVTCPTAISATSSSPAAMAAGGTRAGRGISRP